MQNSLMTIVTSRQNCDTLSRLSGSLAWSSLDSFRDAQGLEAGAVNTAFRAAKWREFFLLNRRGLPYSWTFVCAGE